MFATPPSTLGTRASAWSFRTPICVTTPFAPTFSMPGPVRRLSKFAAPSAMPRTSTSSNHYPISWTLWSGERGYRFSGGEKQHNAIAHLLLKAPDIVILDEATAHLDSESEAAVQRVFDTALAGRTSIVIAHWLSTILRAHQILVQNGSIIQRGTHAELLEQRRATRTSIRGSSRRLRPVRGVIPDPLDIRVDRSLRIAVRAP
jgi:hypothetical protein